MKIFQRIISLLLLLFLAIHFPAKAVDPPFLKYTNDPWVESQMKSMSLKEKIAQLMMVAVFPKQTDESKKEIEQIILEMKPGGLLVMQGSPQRTCLWINAFQEKSTTPLLVATDAEWGLSMRTDSTLIYPYAQALGATNDSALIYKMGYDIGLQLKKMGIHMNFAPVADINSNPDNPVISFRSFGENKINVGRKSWQMANGMQNAGVVAVAKHFPGHGNTDSDSHNSLPVIRQSKQKIDSEIAYPFKYLTERGIPAIMTGHLNVLSLDSANIPASLSKKVISEYLKKEIGFKGLIISDALNMEAIKSADIASEVEALKAGNDMIAYVSNPALAIKKVLVAVEKGSVSVLEIEDKCRKILALKRWLELQNYQPSDTSDLVKELNKPAFQANQRALIKKTITVLRNKKSLPVQRFDTLRIATVMTGTESISSFQKMLNNYTQMDHFFISKKARATDLTELVTKLKKYNLIILGIQGLRLYPNSDFGTTELLKFAAGEIIRQNKTITVFFGNAYALGKFGNINESSGLVLTYQNNKTVQELAAQFIFGAFEATGKLPVNVNPHFKIDDGINVYSNQSFGFSIGEEVGIDSEILEHKIDSLANLGLDSLAYPGCQVLVAKNGNVILHKCYGFHTYEKIQKVEPGNLYDFASVTKATGPLPSLIKLTDQKKINLDSPVSQYYTDFKGSNKERLVLREVLAHQSGLKSGITFYAKGVDKQGNIDTTIFRYRQQGKFDVRVSENLFMNSDYRKTMSDTIRNSPLLTRKKYVYSDLSFHLYPEIISKLTKTPYETYIRKTFYQPLGANSIAYNPHKTVPVENIIPTENDEYFRHELLRGFVHDESAAMMGGVSGNAGLFGNTLDLAKVFQMYLQKGYFGGTRYFSEKTFNEFNKVQYPENENRRGLGFDKPYLGNDTLSTEKSYPARSASLNSFGHSGYTGTFVWADPDNQILFVFMTNRVHPTRNNNKLSTLNLRVLLHQAIYDSRKK